MVCDKNFTARKFCIIQNDFFPFFPSSFGCARVRALRCCLPIFLFVSVSLTLRARSLSHVVFGRIFRFIRRFARTLSASSRRLPLGYILVICILKWKLSATICKLGLYSFHFHSIFVFFSPLFFSYAECAELMETGSERPEGISVRRVLIASMLRRHRRIVFAVVWVATHRFELWNCLSSTQCPYWLWQNEQKILFYSRFMRCCGFLH